MLQLFWNRSIISFEKMYLLSGMMSSKSFESIKDYLTSAPILAISDYLPITIYTDASGVGVGAVLK